MQECSTLDFANNPPSLLTSFPKKQIHAIVCESKIFDVVSHYRYGITKKVDKAPEAKKVIDILAQNAHCSFDKDQATLTMDVEVRITT